MLQVGTKGAPAKGKPVASVHDLEKGNCQRRNFTPYRTIPASPILYGQERCDGGIRMTF